MTKMSLEQQTELLSILEKRFLKNTQRHPDILWDTVVNKLNNNSKAFEVLFKMEETGGEPDVVQLSENSSDIIFVDCSKETPKERRSICYDHQALESRKQYKPDDSAMNMASEIGINMLDENEYFALQKLDEFDLKTSSWIKTPKEIRSRGGALFGDKRFGRVFIYHNGADSYYGVRGFRGMLRIN